MDPQTAYDQWAETYDAQPNPTRDLDAIVLAQEERAWSDLDVVEIGCGTGKNSAWLLPRVRSLVGLDVSEQMLAIAIEAVPDGTFLVADISEPWPLEDDSADLVVASLVLEHIEVLAPIMAEAARVLRRGGTLRISELHPDRQAGGSRAHFVDESGERVDIAAFVHPQAEVETAAAAAGFTSPVVSEPMGPEDDQARLIVYRFGLQ